MYEENLTSLPPGDATTVFADALAEISQHCAESEPLTCDNLVRWARRDIRLHFADICRRLLLPGSGLTDVDQLADLTQLARDGHACLLCLNHRSNLDVPTLHVLLEDQGPADVFDRIIWIAGRKLHEDMGLTGRLLQGFNRIILTPRSWSRGHHTEEELHEAHELNIAALRAMHALRRQGWVFGLFPSGTRLREQDQSTAAAIPETDSYVKNFEFMILAHIEGCTLPVTRDRDLTHETPRLDRMSYKFGPAVPTQHWRESAARRFPQLDQRGASAAAIAADIESLRR